MDTKPSISTKNTDSIQLKPSDFELIKGQLVLPVSKSMANRLLILQYLSSMPLLTVEQETPEDVRVLRDALNSNEKTVDVKMAGTAFRFLTAAYSIMPGTRIITGSPRITQRPIKPLVEALKQLGADIRYLERKNHAPLEITGRTLKRSELSIDAGVSSQFISALMLIGPFLPRGIKINMFDKLISEPYVNLTKYTMESMGFQVLMSKNSIQVEPHLIKPKPINIESDWSAAAYWAALAVLTDSPQIVLTGLSPKGVQGDQKLMEIFAPFGLKTNWKNGSLHLWRKSSSKEPSHLEIDCSSIPDQAQTLAFFCAAKGISLHLTGLQTLKGKETDRIFALHKTLADLGLQVSSTNSTLTINGSITVDSYSLDTSNDHRMAMAGMLLATRIPIKILNPSVVSKSYPMFWDDFKKLTTENEAAI